MNECIICIYCVHGTVHPERCKEHPECRIEHPEDCIGHPVHHKYPIVYVLLGIVPMETFVGHIGSVKKNPEKCNKIKIEAQK